MIVTFTTSLGSKYHLDHTNRTFVQELPHERSGPMWNYPSVVVGKRVEILTAPSPTDEGKVARVIKTGIVSSREVTLEASVY